MHRDRVNSKYALPSITAPYRTASAQCQPIFGSPRPESLTERQHAPLGKRPAARTASQRALFVTIATSSSSFCDPRQPHRNPVLLASVSVHPTSPAFRRLVRAPFKDPSMMPKPRLQCLGDTQAPASGMLRRELRN